MAVTRLTGTQIKDTSVDVIDLSATGIPSSSTFLRGDNVWATPSATGATTGQATVNFGANTQEDGTATVTVSTAAALTASIIFVTPSGVANADHDADDYVAEGIVSSIANIVNGVSFDIRCFAPNNTWGQYSINYVIN